MVRKTVYGRDDVLAAALRLVSGGSMAQLSARRIADELGSSTAPVYSNFENMDELAVAVRDVVADELLACTRLRHDEDEFFSMGLGVLEFARTRPGLYCVLFNPECGDDGPGRRVFADLLRRMADIPELAVLPVHERAILLRKMAIFTHGMASRLCGGLAERYEWEELKCLLGEVGAALYADARARGERTPEEIARLGDLCSLPWLRDDDDVQEQTRDEERDDA